MFVTVLNSGVGLRFLACPGCLIYTRIETAISNGTATSNRGKCGLVNFTGAADDELKFSGIPSV